MKELSEHIKDKTELHAVKPAKAELKYLGTLRPQRGQKIWELNLKTRRITEAEYTHEDANFDNATKGDYSTRGRLITKDNCIYCAALNHKSADRRFFKMLGLAYPTKK